MQAIDARSTLPVVRPHLFCPDLPVIVTPDPPAGRLATLPKDERQRLANQWTLSEFFSRYVWPYSLKSRGRKDLTHQEHLASLHKWESLCGHPPLSAISQEMAARFVERLAGLPGLRPESKLSPATIVKHCVQLQCILDHAGPGDPRRKIPGARLLRRKQVPYLFRPSKPRREPRYALSPVQVWRLLEACVHGSTPRLPGIDPAGWWRSLFLFTYNTGLRRQTLLAARWEWLDEEGWLTVPPEAIKCEQGGRFYCNRFALAAIEPARAWGGELIFPWPSGMNWLHDKCRELMGAAGIWATADCPRCGLHRLRATLLSWLAGENWMISQMVGNHRGGVTQEHYVRREEVIPYLDRVPQPGPPVQKTLF